MALKSSNDDINPRKLNASRVWQKDSYRIMQLIPHVNAVFICWEYNWKHEKDRVYENFRMYLDLLEKKLLPKGVYFL